MKAIEILKGALRGTDTDGDHYVDFIELLDDRRALITVRDAESYECKRLLVTVREVLS